MLTTSALETLSRGLASALASFQLERANFGYPEVVQKAAQQAAEMFKEFASARPSKEAAYAAALAFVRGAALDDEQKHLVAGALNVRIREQGGRRPIGNPRFIELLELYSVDAAEGELWLLTWYGLMCSHFDFDPSTATKEDHRGWSALRGLLQETWPQISDEAGKEVVPEWVKVLREYPELLTERAGDNLGVAYLQGEEATVQRVSAELGVPEASWLWHALVLGAVRSAGRRPDSEFIGMLPRLLQLIKSRPVYRDDALVEILTRYHHCSSAPLHPELRDYVVGKDVWRNPKLRAAGLASAWNRVSDDVWRMVLQWVNKANLRDFFEVLAARGNSDEGRLEFWSKYLEQITWTKLIFSNHTRLLAATNAGVRNLIAREEDSYATLSTNADVDAFMMQIGDYLIVEFSRMPNAGYVYKVEELPFEPHAVTFAGTTADLKRGYYVECPARILHKPGWQADATYQLRSLGIYPDEKVTGPRRVPRTATISPATGQTGSTAARGAGAASPIAVVAPPASPIAPIWPQRDGSADGARVEKATAPRGAKFTMTALQAILADYPGASLNDKRASGGRLWVHDPSLRFALDVRLKAMGFKWATSKDAWYFPEN